ncbi:MAG: gfo/Idh/MocA family oxidoreductase [Acidobacteria bacterium]|nr:MAG: gfo/Idh/MocA family oxidoreductase [Acidobacteriota bacterium]
MSDDSNVSRRRFLGTVAVAGAVYAAACSKSQQSQEWAEKASDGRALKAGLIGCGGRGTGAALDFLAAGTGLSIVALGDVFQDRLDSARQKIEEKGQKIADDKCFVGFDAYQKVINSDIDVVLTATPPHFRPQHFAAAVEAGKHIFMEKPVAVDPVGIRSILDTASKAKTKNLVVVTGTQRRHEPSYKQAFERISNGAIGEIVTARVYWNQGQLWYKERLEGWTDMEWLVRDWVNWVSMSGDHIVEQHVHNLDVGCWFLNEYPTKAVGFGGRARRVTGDQYDFFTVDYEMPSGRHMQSMCRQIDGCANDVAEYIIGTNGWAHMQGGKDCVIYKKDGTIAWSFKATLDEAGETNPDAPKKVTNPYRLEHVDFVTSVRNATPFNEAENTAKSTLTAIMGREAAYTGRAVTWDEIMKADTRLGPTEYALGPAPIEVKIAVPGKAKEPQQS